MVKATRLATILYMLTLVACAHAQQQGMGGTGGIGGLQGIQSGQAPVLRITTLFLANGTIGTAYSQTINTQGGTAPVTFSVIAGALPNGLTLNASTGVISGTPGNNAGTYTFTIQAQDSTSPTPQFATQPYSISIRCTPLSILTATNWPPADQGVGYSFQLTAQGGIAPLFWSATGLPAGEGIISSSGLVTGTPTVTGNFTPQVTVTDSCPLAVQTAKGTFHHTVNATLAITTQSPLPGATVGIPYTTQLAAAGGTTPYGWSVTGGTLPAGLALNTTTGVVSGTPTNPQTTTPTIQVTDALAATASAPFSITAACQALSISSTSPLTNGTQGSLYSFQLLASGGFGALTWSATGLPSGLSISTTGLISGTPTVSGTFTPVITVTDSCPTAQPVTQNFSLTISAQIGPLTITSGTTLPPVNVGAPYNQQLQASGGVTPYTWSVTNNAFPSGITLNSSGVVSGIATTSGTFTPTVQVADAANTTTSAVFTLVTSCPSLSITTGATLASGTQGQAYSSQLAASGGVTPLSWSLISGSLPTGVTLSSGGLISGTPTNTGTFNPQIKVTDACLTVPSTATRTFTIAVAANSGALTITSASPLPGGVQGVPFNTTIAAQGGTPPYSWSLGGTIPVGAEDILDYAMMPVSTRYTSHLSATGLYKAYRLNAGLLWWVKNTQGYPWDGEAYDGSKVYQWFTEMDSSQNAACQAAGWPSCFSDPQAYKKYRTPVALWSRYHVPGADDVVYTPGPNLYDLTVNCGADNQAPIDNLGVRGELTGPFTDITWQTTYGGNIPDNTPYLLAQKWIKCTSNSVGAACPTEEDYWLVKGYGQVRWCPKTWNGTTYVTGTCTTQTTVSAGGAPTPNFACKIPSPVPVASFPVPPGVTTSSSTELNIVDNTGAMSGTPTKSGSYSFVVQVEDAVGAIAQKTFSHTITCPAISITSTSPLPGATQNQVYNFQFNSSGGAVPVTWSATGVPAGLTLSTSGLLSGTPTATGTSTIAVTATDSCSPSPQTAGPTNFSLTVAAQAPPLTLVTTSPLPAATEGKAYSLQMAAQGGATPYSWSTTAGSFPAGLSMNTSGLITGTPTTTGTSTPTIRVTDAATATASLTYSLTVSCPALSITSTSPLPPATQGTAYSFQMQGTGGIAPLTWSASGLPTGLTLSSAGAITGTPSVNGTFTPSITLHDSCVSVAQTITQSFTLQVNNNLAITTQSPLPAGTVNNAYSATLSAAGGTPPYTWTMPSGSLPAGLLLNGTTGVISGTPTTAQTTTPTFKVTDSVGGNVSAVFSITINAASGADNRYCSPSGTWQGATTDGPASLPTQCMYTALSGTPSNGTVRGPDSTLTALQTDVNNAACGDTILVTAGSVMSGTLTLKPKGCTNSWITIKSTGVASANFPPEGTRATPCIAGVTSLTGRPSYTCANGTTPLTFQIAAPRSSNAIVGPGADHYRIIGAELTRDQTPKIAIFAIIDLSGTSPITNNIIFDRVWCHGVNATNFPQTSTTDTSTTRCLYLGQSNHVAVIDSYISDFYDNGSTASNGNTDSQCVGGGVGGVPNTGWGVYKFVNNHCEGGSEGLILGGSGGPALTPTGCTFGSTCNLDVPTDIEVRRNYFFAPRYWDGNTTTNNATGWPNRKNGIEFKTGARILLEANVMENCNYSSQPYCYVFDFAPKNQSNAPATPTIALCPSCLVQDFTARYNYGYNYPGIMVAIYSTMDIGCSTCFTLGRRGSVHDNLTGDNLNLDQLPLSGADGIEFLADAGPMTQISIRHNTNVASVRSSLLWGSSTAGTGRSGMDQIVFQDNLMFSPNNANNGWHTWLAGNGSASGTCDLVSQTLSQFLATCINGTTPTWTVDHNGFFFPGTISFTGWPAGSLTTASISTVGFTTFPANNARGFPDSGFNPGTYKLTNTSPFHNAASDGTDIGANIPLLQSMIAGVRGGTVATGSAFYISTSGADTNNGLTPSSPWLHAPGMSGCSNNCAARTPKAGDSYILRGGDVWHYNAGSGTKGLPWTITGTGTATNPIYYGVDHTWFNPTCGSSWCRPVLNGDNPTSATAVASCGAGNATNVDMVDNQMTWGIWDDMELTGLCWNQAVIPFFGDAYVAMDSFNSTYSNIYIHGWTHTAAASSQGSAFVGSTDGRVNHFDGVVVDGSDSDPTSLGSGYNLYDIHNSVFRYHSNCGIANGAHTAYNNLFEFCTEPYDGAHGNVLEWNNESSQASNFMYNNLVRNNLTAVTMWVCPGPSNNDYYFNNIVYGNLQQPWDFDNTGSGGVCTIGGTGNFINNTFGASTDNSGPGASGSYKANFQNSYFVSISGPGGTPLSNTNAIQNTTAQATARSYTSANNFVPTTTNCAGNATLCPVGAGNNYTSVCNALIAAGYTAEGAALCQDSTVGPNYDAVNHRVNGNVRTPLARPATGAWDSGAVQSH